MTRIGVLALQGSVIEHIKMLSRIDGIEPVAIKTLPDLQSVSGLILPGGESTTMGKLIREFGLMDAIAEKARNGMPIWGTCAGMILLAKEISDEKYVHLGVMDISVRRNAYGSQLESFSVCCSIPGVSDNDLHLVFIRAPRVEKAWGSTKVLAEVNGKIAAVQQNNMIATSFHPELTEDLSFHKYFAGLVQNYVR